MTAVIDSGIDKEHPALKSTIARGWDFVDLGTEQQAKWERNHLLENYQVWTKGDFRFPDDNPEDEFGHGTHCAGIIAAHPTTVGGIRVRGVCPWARILPVRTLLTVVKAANPDDRRAIGTTENIRNGIIYAVEQKARVLNFSLVVQRNVYHDALKYAYEHDVCLIAAVGNEGARVRRYPAADSRVLAVGTIDQFSFRHLSNYGSAYGDFVMAPGTSIYSTWIKGGYQSETGSSTAAAFVSGLAGLMIGLAAAQGKTLKVETIYALIRDGASLPAHGRADQTEYGCGVINVEKTLSLLIKRIEDEPCDTF